MKSFVASTFCLVLSSCVTVSIPFGPHVGGGNEYSFYNGPSHVVMVKKPRELREGRACATTYLSLVTTGDASIEASKAKGGLTQIVSVDYKRSNFLGLIGETCTIDGSW